MDARNLPHNADYAAPDGSEVRLLVQGAGGGMAHFRLVPGEKSLPKMHRSVEELWFFVAGRGEMCVGDAAITVCEGVSVRIPPRTRFQFRSDGSIPLEAVAVTMPPWPGADEAEDAEPFWRV
jgi:mannose-6-phosphate isomerase-like protein (cupin superfamily)